MNKKYTQVERYEESNQIKFLETLFNKSDYPSAYSLIKLGRLDWGKTKIFFSLKIYKTIKVFQTATEILILNLKLKSEYLEFII